MIAFDGFDDKSSAADKSQQLNIISESREQHRRCGRGFPQSWFKSGNVCVVLLRKPRLVRAVLALTWFCVNQIWKNRKGEDSGTAESQQSFSSSFLIFNSSQTFCSDLEMLRQQSLF